RKRIGLAGGHERGRDHPQQGTEREEGARDQGGMQRQRGHELLHRVRSRDSLSWIKVPVSMIRNSRNAMAAAMPMRHQRNPCAYRNNTNVIVDCSGPPCVITQRSPKSWN